jgi:hypothetical protein
MKKQRLIVLTDIERGFEQDDIQSMVRLMLYANEIDIEGLVATTSCFYHNGAKEENKQIILDIIAAYETVKPNLLIHANGYPSAEQLRAITCCGIPAFGDVLGSGWGSEKWIENEGVNLIINAVDKDDDRPIWVTLWGGGNTLAQAIWQVKRSRSEASFNDFMSKIRVYGISDQDYSARWLRDNYGDKLFYIVSPSPGGTESVPYFKNATWPGISGDNFNHGSEDGIIGGGFTGADSSFVSPEWINENIMSKGALGAQYPPVAFLMEGDTPSYLGLIPNGLNNLSHPGYGGWGGRYKYGMPEQELCGVTENFPIWCSDKDCVTGIDGRCRQSPQASIWRWREAIQNDFAARMDWTVTSAYEKANHPPVVKLAGENHLYAKPGDVIELDASLSIDPNGNALNFLWQHYPEAGGNDRIIEIDNPDNSKISVAIPSGDTGSYHFIVSVTNEGVPPLTRYARVIISIMR